MSPLGADPEPTSEPCVQRTPPSQDASAKETLHPGDISPSFPRAEAGRERTQPAGAQGILSTEGRGPAEALGSARGRGAQSN